MLLLDEREIQLMSSSSNDSDSVSLSDFEDIEVPLPTMTTLNASISQEQWIKAIDFSSYKSKYPNSIPRGSGVEKLVHPITGDILAKDSIDNAWILSNSNQEEQVVVSFETSVFINEIHIYTCLNPECIVKLEMFQSQRNQWWTMWQRKSSTVTPSSSENLLKPLLRRYHLKTKTIRLTIDPRSTDLVAIRAIKLIGSNVFDGNLHRATLAEAMDKLYQQARLLKNSDVQFIIDGNVVGAHRNILCCRSKYFRALLLSDFSEKYRTEPIPLTDVDLLTFMEILRFIYTGVFHPDISHETIIQCMMYCNKIDFLSGKNTALEKLCRSLNATHDLIIPMYCLAKQMSPAFDLLLEYIYELCSRNMNDICKQKDFSELDRELMVDLICQASERRALQEQRQTSNNATTTTR